MTRIVYEIVKHDGGWAYRAGGTYSESFSSHDAAHQAAERVAREQMAPGEAALISYEDSEGRWHKEVSAGTDRPAVKVSG